MPFSIRPFRRFPVQCSVTYNAGPFQGQGTVWNLSVNGWKLSGDVPLRVGQMCSLTVTLPNQPSFFVAAAIVRWVRGHSNLCSPLGGHSLRSPRLSTTGPLQSSVRT